MTRMAIRATVTRAAGGTRVAQGFDRKSRVTLAAVGVGEQTASHDLRNRLGGPVRSTASTRDVAHHREPTSRLRSASAFDGPSEHVAVHEPSGPEWFELRSACAVYDFGGNGSAEKR